MNKDESLQLLSQKAFKKDHPEEDYLELSKSVVQYARGLPLALKVLGCFLCGRSISEWEDALDKLKLIPENNIFQTLKISYDGLDHEEKTMFLDIACFFKGWRSVDVIQALKSCGFHAIIGLNRLIEKSLLIETDDDYIQMHDLLQDLGKSIVFQESPNDACKRSRLWTLEDIDEVLKNNIGTEAIEGMVLHSQEPYEAYWIPEAFAEMRNLRLLILSSEVNLPRGLKCLSNGLKVLQWPKYPLKALPLEIPNKLVTIKLQYSKIKQLWYGVQCLGKLKFIDLSHSQRLIKTPNFVGVPNLERLILEGCTSLVEVHPSFGELKMLVEVSLKDCRSLKILPKKLEMNSLMVLILCGCSKVENFPEFGESMKNLILLDLQNTLIAELPESLGFLIGLEHLNLKGCKNLVSVPHTFNKLKYLRTLNLSSCPKFSNLPENLNENEALESLDVSETSIKEAPSSIIQLRNLKTLSFYGCKGSTCNSWSLHHISWKMFGRHPIPMGLVLPRLSSLTSLTQLNLSYCGIADGSIMNDIGGLSLLSNLDLRGNNFVNLPAGCISNLSRLDFLDLGCCPRLKALPNLPHALVRLNAGNCPSMEPLSDEQLWYHFSSLDRDPHKRRSRFDNFHNIYASLVSPLYFSDFIACIPGNEIPSWFPNKNECFPAPKYPNISEISMTIDIPQCCLESE